MMEAKDSLPELPMYWVWVGELTGNFGSQGFAPYSQNERHVELRLVRSGELYYGMSQLCGGLHQI
jgi:hypothetical protein